MSLQSYGAGRRAVALSVLLTGAVVPAGCGTESSPGESPPPASFTASPPASLPTSPPVSETTVTQSPRPRPTTPGSPPADPGTPGGTGQAPAAAIADLSGRLGVEPARVKTISVEEVTWPDASLGCPKPGMMYAQVLTEGTRIVLEANGRRYEYHAGRGREPFLCENPQRPAR